MAKPEWGVKRHCVGCGTRFYDLCRDPIICPKCQTVFEIEASLKVRRANRADAKPAKSKVASGRPAEVDDETEELDQPVERNDDSGVRDNVDDEDDTPSGDDELEADADLIVDEDEDVDVEDEDNALLADEDGLDDDNLDGVVNSDIGLDEEKDR